ncbi:MAG: DUF1330 domain-containing protein [Candidatus Acidiferrales bacterium]
MKLNYKLLIGVVAGVLAGAAGNNAIHGQQVKTPVYVIGEADAITDPLAIKEYAAKADGTLAPFNGHVVARSSKAESLDGAAPPIGIAVIAFDSSEQAHAWYNSPAYTAIRPIRLAASKGRVFIVEGVAIQ